MLEAEKKSNGSGKSPWKIFKFFNGITSMCIGILCKYALQKYYILLGTFIIINDIHSIWLVARPCIECALTLEKFYYLLKTFIVFAYQVYTQSTTQFICMFTFAQ